MKLPPLIVKSLIVLVLGLLVVSAFLIRLENFKYSRARSIDEIVYTRMAFQVLNNPSDYHTIPFGQELSARGRKLPEYFFKPLYKHPPVFTYLISLSMKLFDPNLLSVGYVSLALGVLMIPLIYLLGTMIDDRTTGLLAAFFLWLDPVNIICSQKVWPDTSIAFFALVAAVCFVGGLKGKKDFLFILSGVASGLAANMKYPGILITFAIFLFAVLNRRDLFQNKKFVVSLFIPFLMLIPWGLWNWKVYGIMGLLENREFIAFFDRIFKRIVFILPVLIIVVWSGRFLLKRKRENINAVISSPPIQNTRKVTIAFIIAVLILLFYKPLLQSLHFTHIPFGTWQQGIVQKSLPIFYFSKLIEFSFLYVFSFGAIFLYHADDKQENSFLRIAAVIILVFFTLWRGYQSRYVIASLPLLIVLGVQLWKEFFEKLSEHPNATVALIGSITLRFLVYYVMAKTYYLNLMFSFTNDMCYF